MLRAGSSSCTLCEAGSFLNASTGMTAAEQVMVHGMRTDDRPHLLHCATQNHMTSWACKRARVSCSAGPKTPAQLCRARVASHDASATDRLVCPASRICRACQRRCGLRWMDEGQSVLSVTRKPFGSAMTMIHKLRLAEKAPSHLHGAPVPIGISDPARACSYSGHPRMGQRARGRSS